jgi:uncharacterized membrane protein YphA (DoxX/SURF4 family)
MDNSIKARNKWANAHTNYWFDTLRILLGIFLIYKGVTFITNTGEIDSIIASTKYFKGGDISFYYIAIAHLMGGVMIIFGLITRWAIIAQIPILLGAILVNFVGDFNLTNFLLAILTLIVCSFFIYYGSGKHSADYYFKLEK